MDSVPHPLESRSLPGALWEKAPKWLSETDENLRAWFASHVNGSLSPWKELRWLTENDFGILIATLLFIAAYFYVIFKNRAVGESRLSVFKKQSIFIFLLLILGAFSNLVSVALKQWIGRFKPHVNWWDQAAPPPALSCPSSHAFNTAFLLILTWLLLSPVSRKKWKNYFAALSFFVILVGMSRIVFTQHYPFDVILGWVLGGGLAMILRPFVKRFLSSRRF